MKNLLFESWRQWKVCFLSGLRNAGWGIWRIITCMVFGFISLCKYLFERLAAAVSKYPKSAIVIFAVTTAVTYVLTFTSGRARTRTAEYQRDSIGYCLDKYLQAYDTTSSIIVGNDTIRHGYDVQGSDGEVAE